MMFISTQSSTSSHAVKHPRPSTAGIMIKIVLACCVLPFASSLVPAQNIQFTQGSIGTSLDNTLQIPLRTYQGRGAANLPVSLYYSSQVWRINHLKTITYGTYLPITAAIYAEHSTAGWKTSLDIPKIEWPKDTDGYFYTGKPYNFAAYPSANAFRVRRVYIHMPDGSRHELRKSDQPYQGAIDVQGTFYAVDSSRMRYVSTGSNTGTLYIADGSRYILNGSTAQYIDRNGNTLNYNASTKQWTDTLGRVISAPPMATSPGDYTYTLPGIGGSSVNYTFRWKYLSDAGVLTPDPVTGLTPTRKPIANEYLPNPNLPPTPPSGGNYPQYVQQAWSERPSLFISDSDELGESYAVVVGHNQNGGELFNPVVLTEIVLPNGLSYKFSYNIYGEIDKVIYPTGAFDRYTYSELPGIGDIQSPYTQANRGVVKRQLSADGTGTDIAEWLYTVAAGYGVPSNTLRVTTKAPDNTWTESYRQNFKAPQQSGRNNPHFWPFGFEDVTNGMMIDERTYAPNADGTKGPMLRRKLTKWEKSEQDVAHRIMIAGDEIEKAYRNARPAKEVNIILDTGGAALAKTLTYSYDTTHQLSTGLDLLVSTESHFADVDQTIAQTGLIDAIASGQPASSAEKTYLSDPDYRDRNILGLPTSVTLRDANGQAVSKTEHFYDEAAFPILTYSDLNGVPDYLDPGTPKRGNVTTVRRYTDLIANFYLETHMQYDQCGNLRNGWDERGNQSQTEYSSTYKHAFTTQATTAVPDPSGTHGSHTAFISSNTYDYHTGLALTSTDANGQITTLSYRDEQNTLDPLLRLRKVTRPDGSWTRHSFSDVVGNLYTQTETQFDATRVTISRQYFDKLGRTVRAFAYENTDPNAQWMANDTHYDQMGRVSKVSTAYRTSTPSATLPQVCTLCTTSTYDALGRVTSVTLPDGTSGQTTYQGLYTTVTDQAGKQRRQKVDALGRIVRLDEPDANNNLGAVATLYDYDTQGNVIHVQQGTGGQLQHRYFKYDALGRLTYERQVEQAAIFTAADALTGNNQWSRKLVYDEGGYQGLPTTMVDALNTQTQYHYDNLNRIYQISYSDGTPTVKNYYDAVRFTMVGETRTIHNLGRLAEVTTEASGSVPATSQAYNYDLMGRVANTRQMVGANAYTMVNGYNLGGVLESEKYPSGRVVNYSYDDSARLNSLTSGATVYASNFVYGAKGTLTSFNLGNGSVQSFAYNDRLQLTASSLSKDSNMLQRYEFKYGKVNADGSVDETKNNGQIGRIEGFIGASKQWQQRFSYDTIGRLSQASEYRGDNSQQSYLINYNYDAFGNRYQYQAANPNALSFTPVEDGHVSLATNRLTFPQITYDAAGNILTDNKFRGRQYQYDANGRQKWTALNDGTGASTSVYDGTGQRVATVIGGVVTNIMVYGAGGKLVAEYGTSPPPTGGTQYVFADHQGSTRVTMTQTGGIISRHDYQPFGEEIYSGIGQRTPAQGYDQSDSVKLKYAGMEKDDATGMAHTLWRKYDGMSGRWTSPDPYGGSMTVEDPQSFNRYTYVNNDPVNKVDPSGLMLSDIGVYQTTNERVARGLAYQCVLNLQASTTSNSGGGSRSPNLNEFAAPSVKEMFGQTQSPNTLRNGNQADMQTDQELTSTFTDDGMVIGASAYRNLINTDSHFRLATDGTLHTIHVYGDISGNKIVGVYIPASFTEVKYVGTRMNSVVAYDPKTNIVIRISHVQVYSQKELDQNRKTTNKAGSQFIGKTGGPQGDTAGDRHAHLTIFRGKDGMANAMAYKYKKGPYGEYDRNVAQHLGNFRMFIKR